MADFSVMGEPYLQRILNNPELDILPMIGLLTHTYNNTGELTESKASDIQGYRMKLICDFINSGSSDAEQLRFEKEMFLNKLDSVTDKAYGNMRPDGAINLPEKKIVTVVEYKGNLGFDLKSLDSEQILPERIYNALIQVFCYSMATSTRYGILTDGVVLIMVKISVDKFFADPQKYKDSHILPFEFKLSSIRGPLAPVMNFILEAREESRNSDIEQMAEFYKINHDTRNQNKRRRPNTQ